MRTGLLAKKIGMSRTFAADGSSVPVTILKIDNCQVVNVKTKEKDGYNAVVVGTFPKKAKNIKKPVRGQFAKAKVEPKQKLVEFRVNEDGLVSVGTRISAYQFVAGQKVDVTGTSIGKGFAGGMKRHNFGGLEATHGISVSHRSHGSTGHCQEPGRVFKGKKMAGQMGNVRVTKQNLEVFSSDEETGTIIVRGSVPGPKGGFVIIKDAVKAPFPAHAPFPVAIYGSKEAEAEAEAAKEEAKEAAIAEKEARDAQIAEAAKKQAAADKEEAKAEDKGDAAPANDEANGDNDES